MFWRRKVTKNDVINALKGIVDPRSIESILIQQQNILVTLDIDPKNHGEMTKTATRAKQILEQIKYIESARIILTAEKKPAAGNTDLKKTAQAETRLVAPQVKHIIAVASGKGGVGKSTVAVNLALALHQSGLAVGLLDADVYGPSVPMLTGLRDKKPQTENDFLIPLEAHGIKIMSMGFLVDEEAPMVWRGPMVQSALLQMLRDVQWGMLDVLVIDMPPGTGDTQLTIAQRVKLAGAVIVSTPQDIALLDTVKGVQMFQKVSVPILGIIENMSFFVCPHCGESSAIFGHEGARKRAAALNVDFLGEIPLHIDMRQRSDEGSPIVLQTDHPVAKILKDMAVSIYNKIQHPARQKPAPLIVIEK